jgi:hypothetical protein
MLPGAMLVLGEEVADKALPPPLRLYQVLTDEVFQVRHVHCKKAVLRIRTIFDRIRISKTSVSEFRKRPDPDPDPKKILDKFLLEFFGRNML